MKTWDELKQEYGFHENKRFLFIQLLHKSWQYINHIPKS